MNDPSDNHDPVRASGRTAADAPATLTDRVRALRLPAQVNASRPRGGRLPWILCGVLLLVALAFGYKAFMVGGSAAGAAAQPVTPTGSLAVADSGDVVLESKGYIIPAHQIQVSPKVGGMVFDLFFKEGDKVAKDFVLAELEKDDYEADRDHAQKQVEVAQAQIDAADAGIDSAKSNLQRAVADLDQMKAKVVQYERDWERAQLLGPTKVLAGVDVDTIKASYETARSALAVGQAAIAQARFGVTQAEKNKAGAERSLEQAQADLRKAAWRLKQCTVIAPVAGTILTKKAEKGNVVNPIAFNVSASLCDMADLSDLEVDLTIQERDIAQVKIGQKCRVVPEAYTSKKYEGYVSRVMPTADRAKGAIPVRVKVKVSQDEEGVYLKPDMSVIVSFTKEIVDPETMKKELKPEEKK
jgi:multidrug resistance efflux pump